MISGVTIPAGAQVFALFASANRDGAVFDRPDEFDPAGRTGTGTSRSAAASTTASAPRWPGWRRETALRLLRERLPALRLDPGFRIPYVPNLMHRGPRPAPR